MLFEIYCIYKLNQIAKKTEQLKESKQPKKVVKKQQEVYSAQENAVAMLFAYLVLIGLIIVSIIHIYSAR